MQKEFVMIKTQHTEEDEPILISDNASQEAMDKAGNDIVKDQYYHQQNHDKIKGKSYSHRSPRRERELKY